MLENILISLLAVGGLGLLCGVLLAVISKLFGIPTDEKVVKIRECLPGANCGACGYKGCDDYAAALATGKVPTNLCIPGGEATVTALSEILGTTAEAKEIKTAFVHCNGNCEATETKSLYSGVMTCRAASTLYGGPEKCLYGCMGYGDCAAVCPSNAICVRDGIAHVDPTACIGCGLCVRTCPKHIISLIPQASAVAVMCNSKDKGADARKACSNACIACKKCEKSCPEGAIQVKDNLAQIDYSKCTSCGACTEVCPTKCIKPLTK